ncbi:GIY-YIG nuclease family protein [Sphingobacterium paucimobilis]|uniref:GIY-YIG domain-containing protein n=1 Tax=Sphingobacterium paucimobilis HER1398 TaxID=1346330 RepID=U2J5Y3_9SPHI|nr:GIY-YIG nuclease family protein [Sphingobacterium paucimobilis]ERJ57898.1 hypothetical protein M472_03885 [Sphingobacterium paucimobilis HER1398]ERJ60349.1 hypothetical protein M472_16455 [Sphingobacterium paucimobilis HER1398]ERJ61216.1 hypothetical protein M472_20905 [Sphingobacterium paucimobilis HER1398]
MFTVYILYSVSLDRYYVGFTGNLVERLRRHNSYSKGYTGRAKDWVVVYREAFADKSAAMEREGAIKSWKSRVLIEELIRSVGLEHPD